MAPLAVSRRERYYDPYPQYDDDNDEPLLDSSEEGNNPGHAIEADSEQSDDSQSVLSTKSLRESIFSYIHENGRTYHRRGDYFLPNDEGENDRLNIQFIVLKRLFNDRDYFAPIKNPRRILDIGTGTGVWCTAMADEFPRADITGTDMSPNFVAESPKNVRFEICDATEDSWGERPYDYIHTRIMLGAFNDFRTIIAQGLDNLEPGGWMESQEMWPTAKCDDGTMSRETSKLCEWIKYQDEAAMKLGYPLRIANKLKRWYEEAGFVDVHQEIFKIPIGGWPKDPQFKLLGRWWGFSLTQGLNAFSMALFTRAFNWSQEEVMVYLVDVRKTLQDKRVHAYHEIYTVWARKPTLAEQKIIDAKKLEVLQAQYAKDTEEQTLAEQKQTLERPPADDGSALTESTTRESSEHTPENPQPSQGSGRTNGTEQRAREASQRERQPRTSESSNRRPKAPFSSSPHPRF